MDIQGKCSWLISPFPFIQFPMYLDPSLHIFPNAGYKKTNTSLNSWDNRSTTLRQFETKGAVRWSTGSFLTFTSLRVFSLSYLYYDYLTHNCILLLTYCKPIFTLSLSFSINCYTIIHPPAYRFFLARIFLKKLSPNLSSHLLYTIYLV